MGRLYRGDCLGGYMGDCVRMIAVVLSVEWRLNGD